VLTDPARKMRLKL